MKKKALLCIGLALLAWPQMSMAQEFNQEDMAARMEEMMDKQATKLAEDLGLKDDARTGFVTTYKAYQQELLSYRTMPNNQQEQQNKKDSELTDDEANARLKTIFERKELEVANSYNILVVEKKYYEEFSKTLTPQQLLKVFSQGNGNGGRGGRQRGGNQRQGGNQGGQGGFGGGQGGFGGGMGGDW